MRRGYSVDEISIDVVAEEAGVSAVSTTTSARRRTFREAAMTEETALPWAEDPSGMTRDELVGVLALSLPALVDLA